MRKKATIRAYKNISVKIELAEVIETFVEENPKYGYRSIAGFMEDAARRRLEELGALGVKSYSKTGKPSSEAASPQP